MTDEQKETLTQISEKMRIESVAEVPKHVDLVDWWDTIFDIEHAIRNPGGVTNSGISKLLVRARKQLSRLKEIRSRVTESAESKLDYDDGYLFPPDLPISCEIRGKKWTIETAIISALMAKLGTTDIELSQTDLIPDGGLMMAGSPSLGVRIVKR